MNWERVKKYSQKAGKEVLALAEACFLTMKDPFVSSHHKLLIVAALTYLLLPVDALPDFLPGGYADDLTVMFGALVSVGKVGKKHLKECRLKHGLVTKDKD